eukprot:7271138-Pyramimonas_sp.AAC.1
MAGAHFRGVGGAHAGVALRASVCEQPNPPADLRRVSWHRARHWATFQTNFITRQILCCPHRT